MSLRCNFILFFLVANELWIKAKVQEQNKTWNFPRLARGFIWRRVIDRLDYKGYVSVSWLPVCWLRRNCPVYNKQVIDVLDCLLRANLYSDVHPFKEETLIASDVVWRTRRVTLIEDARNHLKVTFEGKKISLQRFYRTTKIIWLKLYRFTLSVINLLLSKFVYLLTIHWCKRRKSSAKTLSSVLSQTKSNSWSAQRFINKNLGSSTLTKWSE